MGTVFFKYTDFLMAQFSQRLSWVAEALLAFLFIFLEISTD
jgi:hypothetical protein